MKDASDANEKLEQVLDSMRLLQTQLEEGNFDITAFEEVEIFLDLAVAAGERAHQSSRAATPKLRIVS